MNYCLLTISVREARNLIPMDSNGFADPYFKVKRISDELLFTYNFSTRS